MWGAFPARCPVCGAPAAPDYLYCFRCGTAIIPAVPYPTPPARRAGDRTRAGLLWTVAALAFLWIPGVAALGALSLSVGSSLLYLDRRGFPAAHRAAMIASYLVLWVAAAVYAVLFLQFLGEAWAAWENFEPLSALHDDVSSFVLLSTVPTVLVAVALVLPIRSLLPPRLRRHAVWAGVALVFLIGLATVLSYQDVAAGLGSERVRAVSVLGVLNRISLFRLVEGPAFAWLAYLYWRARENVVPVTGPRPRGAGVPE